MPGLFRFAALLLLIPAAAAQDPLRFTAAADLLRLTPQQAEEQRVPVKMSVIITGTSKVSAWCAAQQGVTPLRLRFASRNDLPPPNSEVEITGVTRGAVAGTGLGANSQPETHIEVHSAVILRRGVTPEPVRISMQEAQEVRHPLRWVEVEGTVLQMRRFDGDLHVHLAGDTGWVIVFVRDVPLPLLPPWLGSRVKMRGIGSPGAQPAMGSLGTCGLSNVEVLTAPLPGTFSAPERTPAELRESGSSSSRYLVRGTVMFFTPGDGQVWLRDPLGQPFAADFLYPFPKSGTELRTEISPIPSLHAGDTVDVVGSPVVESPGLRLRYSEMRVTGAVPQPAAKSAALADAAQGRHRHDLVSLRGRPVFQGTVTPQPGQRFEVVRLASGGAEVEAFFDNAAATAFPRFGPDDLLEATGLAIAPGSGSADRLMLRTAQDIRSLGLAPEVVQMRQWRNLGITGGSVLLAGTIIFLLRRQVVKERALAGEVRSLNATLETRVAQRTAELEHAREELKAALNEEREVGELKSRFVSTVSHEFRTPLGVIMSATDILESYMDRLPLEKKQEHLTEIRSATRHMSGMMEDVLLLGRAESGRLKLTRRPLDLLDLSQRIANEAHSATSQTGTTVITSDPLPPDAMVDEMLLRHMLSNLLSNAIKYSPAGAEVKLHLTRDGKDAVITVSDTGIGIPAEDAPKLFQPFARAGNVGSRSGTGLGLVVVRRCAELHGGSVSFSGRPGGGTVFTLRIPAWENLAES